MAELQSEDTQKPPAKMDDETEKATWLAYNRRVDIILEPKGQESTEAYPNDATDARLLWQRPVPSLKVITSASLLSGGNEQASNSIH